jgi:tyrosyl-tRNA synthetase
MSHILDTLHERGFIKQIMGEDKLRYKMSQGPMTFYIGFDPTGDCLHVGHLLPIMCMAWLQRSGHKPIIVLGGGTAMVGDPSGKEKTREMLTNADIEHNLESQRPLFGKLIDLEQAKILNNADWLCTLNYINFLRDIGKHFSVNTMIKAEGARQRLERQQGYSFIEFNYHLLQSYDFLHLAQNEDCFLQVGGDDQWFHFCGGVELIRRELQKEAYAFTIPLLATADGKKMGKTEKGAVWIDQNKVSSYDYYQYWVNVQDADVIKLMKSYTFMPMEEIATYATLQGADIRKAKHKLALETTTLVHGREAGEQAQQAAFAMFQNKGNSQNAPQYNSSTNMIINILVDSGLCSSKSDARRQIKGSAIKVDYGSGKERIENIDAVMKDSGVLWRGKKRCVQVILSQ